MLGRKTPILSQKLGRGVETHVLFQRGEEEYSIGSKRVIYWKKSGLLELGREYFIRERTETETGTGLRRKGWKNIVEVGREGRELEDGDEIFVGFKNGRPLHTYVFRLV